MASLIERHQERIAEVVSCFDRVLVRATLPAVCHAQAMATLLDSRGIRLFDYGKQFAEPLREAIRSRAERVGAESGIESSTPRSRRGSARRTAFGRSSRGGAATQVWSMCSRSSSARGELRLEVSGKAPRCTSRQTPARDFP